MEIQIFMKLNIFLAFVYKTTTLIIIRYCTHVAAKEIINSNLLIMLRSTWSYCRGYFHSSRGCNKIQAYQSWL